MSNTKLPSRGNYLLSGHKYEDGNTKIKAFAERRISTNYVTQLSSKIINDTEQGLRQSSYRSGSKLGASNPHIMSMKSFKNINFKDSNICSGGLRKKVNTALGNPDLKINSAR